MADAMRLDLFLWWTRLAKTRAAAQGIAADGRLRLDGRMIDRAHAGVRIGNVLTFAQGPHIRVLRIEALPRRRGPAPEARACYIDLASENVSQQSAAD